MNKKEKAVVFDLDGTLVENPSSWEAIFKHFGIKMNNDDLEKYMNLEISDDEFMRVTIEKWPPNLHVSKIKEILSKCKIMKGAKKTIKKLRQRGFEIGIISCGLDILAYRVAIELGINSDYVMAEGLEINEKGYLTGRGISRVEIFGKGEALLAMSKK